MTRAHDLELLGLAADAETNEIRAAYRARALVDHPDRGGDDLTMSTVTDAYHRLLDTAAPDPRAPARPDPEKLPARDDETDDFTIGHSMLAFVVIPSIALVILFVAFYAVVTTSV